MGLEKRRKISNNKVKKYIKKKKKTVNRLLYGKNELSKIDIVPNVLPRSSVGDILETVLLRRSFYTALIHVPLTSGDTRTKYLSSNGIPKTQNFL